MTGKEAGCEVRRNCAPVHGQRGAEAKGALLHSVPREAWPEVGEARAIKKPVSGG